ncbi:hypothetical protein KFE25_012669 [Diacronema lutheri]|uniref:Uncharacterized protein n=1 Tax=Diacronema lutheri TaxID=2081491 RepID=A0A8J5X2W6_DIALT|nr:hypothetical protein KFE25_012669 [Diacronema lutheri]
MAAIANVGRPARFHSPPPANRSPSRPRSRAAVAVGSNARTLHRPRSLGVLFTARASPPAATLAELQPVRFVALADARSRLPHLSAATVAPRASPYTPAANDGGNDGDDEQPARSGWTSRDRSPSRHTPPIGLVGSGGGAASASSTRTGAHVTAALTGANVAPHAADAPDAAAAGGAAPAGPAAVAAPAPDVELARREHGVHGPRCSVDDLRSNAGKAAKLRARERASAEGRAQRSLAPHEAEMAMQLLKETSSFRGCPELGLRDLLAASTMKTGDFISHHRGQIMRTLVDPEASVFNARASTDELSSFLFDGWQWIGRFGETDALGRPADVGGRRKTRRGGKGSMGRGGGHRAGGDARKRRRLSIARAASASGGAENAGAE